MTTDEVSTGTAVEIIYEVRRLAEADARYFRAVARRPEWGTRPVPHASADAIAMRLSEKYWPSPGDERLRDNLVKCYIQHFTRAFNEPR